MKRSLLWISGLLVVFSISCNSQSTQTQSSQEDPPEIAKPVKPKKAAVGEKVSAVNKKDSLQQKMQKNKVTKITQGESVEAKEIKTTPGDHRTEEQKTETHTKVRRHKGPNQAQIDSIKKAKAKKKKY